MCPMQRCFCSCLSSDDYTVNLPTGFAYVQAEACQELTADAENERQPALQDVQLPWSLRATHVGHHQLAGPQHIPFGAASGGSSVSFTALRGMTLADVHMWAEMLVQLLCGVATYASMSYPCCFRQCTTVFIHRNRSCSEK